MTLSDLYKRLPTIDCKRLCPQYCGVVIPEACLPEELDKLVHLPIAAANGYLCGALQSGRCSIYGERPMICRLWGCMPHMRCPHGCQPSFWIQKHEVEALVREMRNAEKK